MEQTNWGKYVAINNQEYTRKLPRRKFSSLRGAQKMIWVRSQTRGSLVLVQGAACQMSDLQNCRTRNSLFWPLSSWWFTPAPSRNYCRTHFSRPAGCQDHSFLTISDAQAEGTLRRSWVCMTQWAIPFTLACIGDLFCCSLCNRFVSLSLTNSIYFRS